MTLQPRLEAISCQDILELEIKHSGYLKRKIRIVGNVSRWTSCYAVIYQGSVYIYSGPTSRKPDITCSLWPYQRVELQKDRTHEPVWVFFLVPLDSCMPTLIFAAASKRELGQWLAELRLAMLTVHKQPTAAVEIIAQQMRVDSNLSLTCDDYGKLTGFVYHQEQQLSNVNRSESTVSEFEDSSIDTRLQQLTPDPVEANDSEAYYRSAIFEGSREEAADELKRYEGDGVYLVRRNEGREVLTVKGSNVIVKYCLEKRQMDGNIKIEGGTNLPSFPSLFHLLHHYHNNDLPCGNVKLVIPFKLAERAS